MEDLIKRILAIIKKSCQTIIHAKVFSRLKFLEKSISKAQSFNESSSFQKDIFLEQQKALANYRHTYTRHTSTITCILLYQDNYLITGSSDHKVHVWNKHTMEVIHTFTGPASVQFISIYSCYLFISYRNRTISMWNIENKTHLSSISTRQVIILIFFHFNILSFISIIFLTG